MRAAPLRLAITFQFSRLIVVADTKWQCYTENEFHLTCPVRKILVLTRVAELFIKQTDALQIGSRN